VHVLEGLHYAHELADYDGKPLNVVHRDVTPSNILLGYDGRVKLVDFGVAKALDSGTQTRAGVVKGKTGYMAPEAFTDSGHVDRRADIYSVGVLLWETLVGRRMWRHLNSTDRLQRAIEDNPELSRDVQGLIREMQRLDPKNFPGNPELLSNLHGRILAEVEQLELQLRRMVEDKGGRVRSTSGEAAPAGYADAVAEYFRRLSKTER
jgi:serine/threonine-protein kinase